MAVLQVRDLVTRFHIGGVALTAVNQISLSLEKGKILAIVGESGSGKSVTAYSLIHLIDKPGKIESGSIQLHGEELLGAPEKRWRQLRGNRIAMVFQDPMMSLNPVMRIGEQLMETVHVHRHHRSEALQNTSAYERAVEALRRVGIPAPEERMKAYPHELSGGMRQRVAIANAIINNPDVIIADEPTTALDVTIQAQILYEMKMLAKETGTALLWITHDLAVVKDLADEVCVMYAGRIVESGPVEQIIQNPRHPYTRGLLDSLPGSSLRGQRLSPIPGGAPPLDRLPAGCAFAPRCRFASSDCGQSIAIETFAKRTLRCINPLEAQ